MVPLSYRGDRYVVINIYLPGYERSDLCAEIIIIARTVSEVSRLGYMTFTMY